MRGVTKNAELVFYAWGRSDMSQYLADEGRATWRTPAILRPLPDSLHTVEVWCGSEFTLAADEHGRVWGCGWSEHSNVKPVDSITQGGGNVSSWHLIHDQDNASISLAFLGEGVLAAGGGHVVCFRK